MAGLTVQNFLSAALAIALTRAMARSTISTLGNFWVDMTRATLYVLLLMAALVVSSSAPAAGLGYHQRHGRPVDIGCRRDLLGGVRG